MHASDNGDRSQSEENTRAYIHHWLNTAKFSKTCLPFSDWNTEQHCTSKRYRYQKKHSLINLKKASALLDNFISFFKFTISNRKPESTSIKHNRRSKGKKSIVRNKEHTRNKSQLSRTRRHHRRSRSNMEHDCHIFRPTVDYKTKLLKKIKSDSFLLYSDKHCKTPNITKNKIEFQIGDFLKNDNRNISENSKRKTCQKMKLKSNLYNIKKTSYIYDKLKNPKNIKIKSKHLSVSKKSNILKRKSLSNHNLCFEELNYGSHKSPMSKYTAPLTSLHDKCKSKDASLHKYNLEDASLHSQYVQIAKKYLSNVYDADICSCDCKSKSLRKSYKNVSVQTENFNINEPSKLSIPGCTCDSTKNNGLSNNNNCNLYKEKDIDDYGNDLIKNKDTDFRSQKAKTLNEQFYYLNIYKSSLTNNFNLEKNHPKPIYKNESFLSQRQNNSSKKLVVENFFLIPKDFNFDKTLEYGQNAISKNTWNTLPVNLKNVQGNTNRLISKGSNNFPDNSDVPVRQRINDYATLNRRLVDSRCFDSNTKLAENLFSFYTLTTDGYVERKIINKTQLSTSKLTVCNESLDNNNEFGKNCSKQQKLCYTQENYFKKFNDKPSPNNSSCNFLNKKKISPSENFLRADNESELVKNFKCLNVDNTGLFKNVNYNNSFYSTRAFCEPKSVCERFIPNK
ncbi:hypothetical protein O3M35_005025 [Rhynocoris fuscipes]|uniref:Uncharacterized protein n=1 Tax=Rhynocoris fuscipes TaxID=488301 RepID=A0AAW1DGM5_9HEMI